MFLCPIHSGELNSKCQHPGGKSRRAFRVGRTGYFDYLQPRNNITNPIFHVAYVFFKSLLSKNLTHFYCLLAIACPVFFVPSPGPSFLHTFSVSDTLLSPIGEAHGEAIIFTIVK